MATIFYTFYTHFQPDIYDFVLVAFTLFRGLLIPASITVLPQERHCHWTTASAGSCGQQQADTVCIGMLQMLKLRSREASAIVKFVFLILLDLAGQFVDFVSFDGGVEQGEGTFWPLPPNLLYAKPKHSALNPIWHQRFCRDKICA